LVNDAHRDSGDAGNDKSVDCHWWYDDADHRDDADDHPEPDRIVPQLQHDTGRKIGVAKIRNAKSSMNEPPIK